MCSGGLLRDFTDRPRRAGLQSTRLGLASPQRQLNCLPQPVSAVRAGVAGHEHAEPNAFVGPELLQRHFLIGPFGGLLGVAGWGCRTRHRPIPGGQERQMPRRLTVDDVQAVLTAVYGPPPWDLRGETVVERLTDLRQRDMPLAKRFERVLRSPVGQRLFPGQLVPWQETSQGLRARLALLPRNPHLELDIRIVRQALGIPDKHLRAAPGDAIWQAAARLAKPEAIRQVVEDELAAEWLYAHREAAGHPFPGWDPVRLPESALKVARASAAVDLANMPGHAWLQAAPADGAPADAGVPIERAVARLIERHRLPPTRAAVGRLSRHLLTGNPAWLEGWDFSIALVQPPGQPLDVGYDSASVTVVGLDAYVTREDWNEIWERVVKPRQALALASRGQPEARGPRTGRIWALKQVLPIYRTMILNDLTVLQALRRLAEGGDQAKWDRSTVYRGVRELGLLLRPKA